MNDDPKNSGTDIVHGIERKFGIIVLTIIFVILFFGGAFLIWERNQTLQQNRELLAESSQLEALLASMQATLASNSELNSIEEIDFEQYQTITLENGDMLLGKIVKDGNQAITLQQPVHLNGSNANSNRPKMMSVNRQDVNSLRNIKSDSELVKMLQGSRE